MGKRRLILLSMFVFLLVAALSSFARPAGAQLQYVVVYVEFKPADAKAGERVLDELASQALASVGVIRFDVLHQVDRRNFFALFEIWSSAQTFALISQAGTTNHFQLIEVFANQQAFDAHVSAQHTLDFRNDIQPFIGAPYDERLYHFANR
ncbi:MAG TPA: antibiotic biosynthesis monooxygenase [Edaphobacter sp.]|nr:antibiotic biosynthesis monooxygenase [Edaphobacter sp.]